MPFLGANYAMLGEYWLLVLAGLLSFIEICKVKYLSNMMKKDHRFIKKITKSNKQFMASAE